MSGEGGSLSVAIEGAGECKWVSEVDRSLVVVGRSVGWLSVESMSVFDAPVVPSGVPGLEFVLVVSWSRVEMSVLVSVAKLEAMSIGWHWVACRQAQSSRIV